MRHFAHYLLHYFDAIVNAVLGSAKPRNTYSLKLRFIKTVIINEERVFLNLAEFSRESKNSLKLPLLVFFKKKTEACGLLLGYQPAIYCHQLIDSFSPLPRSQRTFSFGKRNFISAVWKRCKHRVVARPG